METKCCGQCHIEKPTSEFHKDKWLNDGLGRVCKLCRSKYVKEYSERNPEKLRAYGKANNLRLKSLVLGHYSNNKQECAYCGFDDIRALSIDHINGGGLAHRREIGTNAGFYRWLRQENYPEGYQVLCMNCQFIKRIENNEQEGNKL